MSKKGRGRRTPEQRIEAQDNRATAAYITRIRDEVHREQFEKWKAEYAARGTVSETAPVAPDSL